mgnify:CR=1 FL=1
MSSSPHYAIPRARIYGGILHTQRCGRCGVAIIQTDYREPEPNGTLRHVWLDARLVVGTSAPEHVCSAREKKPKNSETTDMFTCRAQLWD